MEDIKKIEVVDAVVIHPKSFNDWIDYVFDEVYKSKYNY